MNLLQKIKSLFTSTTNYLLGTDVSYWNGNGKTNDERSWIDWGIMQLKTSFTMIRFADGTTKDTQFERNVRESREKKQPTGIYFYLRPNQSYSIQLESLIKATNEVKPELGVWVDCEFTGGLTPVALKNFIKSFVKDLQANTESEVGIYCRGIWWNTYVARDSFFGTLKLWIARYNDDITGPWSDGKYRPLDWTTWTFWQYSKTGIAKDYGCPLPPYADDDLDMNYYNGNQEQFDKEFNLIEIPLTLEERVTQLEETIIQLEARIKILEQECL